jgi:hypothetical protein
MQFGTLFHASILEPLEYSKMVVTEENFMTNHPEACINGQPNRRVKAYQNWKSLIADKLLLTTDQSHTLYNMKKSITSHPFMKLALAQDFKAEQVVFWEHMGVQCKSKLDYVYTGNTDYDVIIDLKSIEDALDIEKFIINWETYRQVAFYSLAQSFKTGKPNKFYLCFVEKKEPFGTRVIQITDEYLSLGRDRIMQILNKYKDFTPEPPKFVYGEDVEKITPPDWLINKVCNSRM